MANQANHSVEQRAATVKNLEILVREMPLDDARNLLVQQGASLDLVNSCVTEVKAQQRLVQSVAKPASMSSEGRDAWYLGPEKTGGDFWPALYAKLADGDWAKDDANLREESLKLQDSASTKIVALLDNPKSATPFDTRGLVLGYVQSGKTTNFTSVIAKAADAGYKMFIVLSGMTDSLREQTQKRLDENLWALNKDRWDRLTEQKKDFESDGNLYARIAATNDGQKLLCVIKKNSQLLRHLHDWLEPAAQAGVLRQCPTLIIDDEADYATINTNDPTRDPTKVNNAIREILTLLPQCGYIGYTATPFANILINPAMEDDLFPRHFIVDLPQPRNYIGSDWIFGREPLDADSPDAPVSNGHNVVRTVPTNEVPFLRPAGNDLTAFEARVTPSLSDAVRYFAMSTAARKVRGEGSKHATMLVHTSQRIKVHETFRALLKPVVDELLTAVQVDDPSIMQQLEHQWNQEKTKVTLDEVEPISFADVKSELPAILAAIKVVEENSNTETPLDYSDETQTVIVVGGNVLSRGLTLEGLCVAFFVRTSNAYDTLLQMGRWFGYREGYKDLLRIWMTDEMRGWFRDLATVEREIRYDIELLESEGLSPTEFGVRVRTHPQLAITAAAKMRDSVDASVAYSGRRLQTIRFRHQDSDWLEQNWNAGLALVASAVADSSDGTAPEVIGGVTIVRNVTAQRVREFLDAYQFTEGSRELLAEKISGYIAGQNEAGELERFTVAVVGLDTQREREAVAFGPGISAYPIERSRLNVGIANEPDEEANIGVLMSKRDRALDLAVPVSEIESMSNGELMKLRNSPEHGGHGDGSGLVLLYPIDRDSRPKGDAEDSVRENLGAVQDVLGVGIVFPEARNAAGNQTYKTADLSSLVVKEPTEDPGSSHGHS